MHPKCPKCRVVYLESAPGAFAQLSANEAALMCPTCRGYFLSHQVVEHWEKEPFVELSEDDPLPSNPEVDRKTGLCPMGHGILVRARVELDGVDGFHLERCGFCRGVWLDCGEWQRLAASRYLEHLDDLWDPNWQKQRRSEKLQRGLDRALSEQLGEALFRDLASVVFRLRSHPSRAQALAWITQHLDPHARTDSAAAPASASDREGA